MATTKKPVPGATSPMVPPPPPPLPPPSPVQRQAPPQPSPPPAPQEPVYTQPQEPANVQPQEVPPAQTPATTAQSGGVVNQLTNLPQTGDVTQALSLAAMVGPHMVDPETDRKLAGFNLPQYVIDALDATVRLRLVTPPVTGKALNRQEIVDLALKQLLPSALLDQAYLNRYGRPRPGGGTQ